MTFKEYIKSRGESISSLSKKLGVPYSTLHDCIENPKHMKLANVKKASRLFGVSIAFLASLIDPEETTLLTVLIDQQAEGCMDCLYAESQILFTYHNNAIEGNQLSQEAVKEMYLTNKINMNDCVIDVDDIVEIVNSFYLFDEMLKTADYYLSIDLIERYHRIFMNGTKDARDTCFVGGYERLKTDKWAELTSLPNDVNKSLRELLNGYLMIDQPSIKDIIDFHLKFLEIDPFAEGTKRISRLILFKECLNHQFIPLIIKASDKHKYKRALKNPTRLKELVETAQNDYLDMIKTHLSSDLIEDVLTCKQR